MTSTQKNMVTSYCRLRSPVQFFLLGFLASSHSTLITKFHPHLPFVFVTPWTIAHQSPLSIRILQAGILEWVAMSWDLINPKIEPRSPTLQADSLPSELPGKPKFLPKVLPPVFSNNHAPCVLFIYLQFVSLHALYSRFTSENQAGVPTGAMGYGTVKSVVVSRFS